MKLKLLLPISLVFVACNLQGPQIEATFKQILAANASDPQEFLQESISEKSLKYIDELIKISDSLDYKKAQQLGDFYGLPMVTMRIHGQMLEYGNIMGLGEQSSGVERRENLLYLLKITGTGILEPTPTNRIQFDEVGRISNNNAEVKVALDTGNKAKIISTYKMKRTGDLWRLDLLSTMSLEEKLLQQMIRREGLSSQPELFMRDYVANPPEEMEFQYKYRVQ